MSEPENLVLQLLRDMRGDMATKSDLAEVKNDVAGLKVDIAEVRKEMATKNDLAEVRHELTAVERKLGDRITHLNSAVVAYHSSVVGHGMLISEIDERLRRVEQHLNLPPAGKH